MTPDGGLVETPRTDAVVALENNWGAIRDAAGGVEDGVTPQEAHDDMVRHLERLARTLERELADAARLREEVTLERDAFRVSRDHWLESAGRNIKMAEKAGRELAEALAFADKCNKAWDAAETHNVHLRDELAEARAKAERWETLADHLEHCAECSMSSVESCPDGLPLKLAALAEQGAQGGKSDAL